MSFYLINYYYLGCFVSIKNWGLGIGDWGLGNPQSPIPK